MNTLLKEAQLRTPDSWYYNQYKKGCLMLSHGFPTKKLAKVFKANIEKECAAMVRNGMKKDTDVVHKVEPAVCWSVNGVKFASFADALYYKWTECPSGTVDGVFN